MSKTRKKSDVADTGKDAAVEDSPAEQTPTKRTSKRTAAKKAPSAASKRAAAKSDDGDAAEKAPPKKRKAAPRAKAAAKTPAKAKTGAAGSKSRTASETKDAQGELFADEGSSGASKKATPARKSSTRRKAPAKSASKVATPDEAKTAESDDSADTTVAPKAKRAPRKAAAKAKAPARKSTSRTKKAESADVAADEAGDGAEESAAKAAPKKRPAAKSKATSASRSRKSSAKSEPQEAASSAGDAEASENDAPDKTPKSDTRRKSPTKKGSEKDAADASAEELPADEVTAEQEREQAETEGDSEEQSDQRQSRSRRSGRSRRGGRGRRGGERSDEPETAAEEDRGEEQESAPRTPLRRKGEVDPKKDQAEEVEAAAPEQAPARKKYDHGFGEIDLRPQLNESGPDESTDTLDEIELDELPPRMRQAVENFGWDKLMPVQRRSIPYMLAGRDLMVQSKTGSGKTAAFLLPILERIDTSLPQCQALVLVPTRELAHQVEMEARTLAQGLDVRIIAVFGGVGYGPQLQAFRDGAQLVIGTPGRILDHMLKRSLTLEALQMLVLDEADHMLSMGFYPDMKRVQTFLPRSNYNAYMFSATFPPRVVRLSDEFLWKPDFVSLSKDQVHAIQTEHVIYAVPDMDKDRSFVRILEIENPANAIIFCNTKVQVNYVAVVLQRFGFDADALSSDLSQSERERVLGRVRAGNLRFLVATDVAARGIDIPELSHVFQFDVPEDPESYIHRSGRTGRAGSTGRAITLADFQDRIKLERIGARYQIEFVERPLPTDDDIATVVSQRVTVLLESRFRSRDNVQLESLERFTRLASTLGGDEDGSRLLAMMLDDFYKFSLHTPPPPRRGRDDRRQERRSESEPQEAPRDQYAEQAEQDHGHDQGRGHDQDHGHDQGHEQREGDGGQGGGRRSGRRRRGGRRRRRN